MFNFNFFKFGLYRLFIIVRLWILLCKKITKIYCFVNEFNLPELLKLNRDISIIYRNYNNFNCLEDIIKLKEFCKKSKNEIYLSNNIKLAIKLRLNGVYIPSFNKELIMLKFLFT